jgi:hypothetical protein
MMRSIIERAGRKVGLWGALLGVVGAPLLMGGCSSSSATSDSNTQGDTTGLMVSGTADGWRFHDGQTIRVSMGANKIFTPHLRLNILQCADPGGKRSNLPKKFFDCDGNTIQGDSIIVQPNGSFSESNYVVYRLPNLELGESKTGQPVCDVTHQCVLYVGENQNDFTQPKVFSEPFTVSGSTGAGS